MAEPTDRDREMARSIAGTPTVMVQNSDSRYFGEAQREFISWVLLVGEARRKESEERFAGILRTWKEWGRREATQWQPIETAPEQPMMVEYYRSNLPAEYTEGMPEYRDERWSIGFFDGKNFCEIGTGHVIDEFNEEKSCHVTHWRRCREPPR